MSKFKVTPVHLLRQYIWHLLKNNLDFKESDYKGMVPILPFGDQPELDQFPDIPTFMYSYAENAKPGMPQIKSGYMVLEVYSTKVDQLDEVIQFLSAAFEEDDVPNYINRFSSHARWSKGSFMTNIFAGIRITSVGVALISPPEPSETEGGQITASITIDYEAVVDKSVKQFDQSWNLNPPTPPTTP